MTTTNLNACVPLSRLKRINVYMQDDLYNMARMKIELNDAGAKHENKTSISRPTVHGLVSLFAKFIDACSPDHDRVLSAIERYNFPMNAPIEFEERCQQEHMDTVSGPCVPCLLTYRQEEVNNKSPKIGNCSIRPGNQSSRVPCCLDSGTRRPTPARYRYDGMECRVNEFPRSSPRRRACPGLDPGPGSR